MMKTRFPLALIASAIAGFTIAAPAQADAVKVGALRCEVSGGLGLIITSTKEMTCSYHSLRGRTEHYAGKIRKFGIDIGETDRGVMLWDVIAPEDGRRRGALAGEYGGVEASATVGVGVGANALIGGSNRSVTLQPLSVQAQTGLDLSAGVASLRLRLVR